MSDSVEFWKDKQHEFQSTWRKCSEEYLGIEKWQRHDIYTQAREKGQDQNEAWITMTEWPIDDLPEIVFHWDGKSSACPELESVQK